MKILAIGLFALTYILLLTFPKIRHLIALSTAAIFLFLGIMPISKAFTSDVISWNVLLMIAGTMGVVALFIESKMPSLLADLIIDRTPNVKWAIISLALFAGVISAFVDNVATVLMVAPVALNISKKLKISPVPSIIAIAISSNLQGAATLVGDTTSVLLGGYAKMNFMDFFFFQGRIGMFFVVQFGALASTLVLLYFFRNETQPISAAEHTIVKDYFPSFLMSGIVILLILASFIPNEVTIGSLSFQKPETTNGIICMTLFIIGLIYSFVKTHDFHVFPDKLKEIDYTTLLLLFGLFIVIGGLTEVKVVEDISNFFANISDNPFIIYTLIVWASVLFSAFIDNIPYVLTMLPVAQGIALKLNIDPYLLYFGLLSGATLGGNLTPIGASANITALGILRKDGHDVKAWEFMKLSIPFTLAAVTTGYVVIWLLWK